MKFLKRWSTQLFRSVSKTWFLQLVLPNNILCFLLPFFFFKCSLKIGVHIIQGCTLYTVKLIANRWAWGRCLWKRVVVPSEMRASSRARRYPRQPRERQPPPGTVTLRNSVEILTNLYTYHGQPRGREGERQTAALMHKYELEIAQSEYMSSNTKRRPVCWIGAHDPRTPLTSIGSILT